MKKQADGVTLYVDQETEQILAGLRRTVGDQLREELAATDPVRQADLHRLESRISETLDQLRTRLQGLITEQGDEMQVKLSAAERGMSELKGELSPAITEQADRLSRLEARIESLAESLSRLAASVAAREKVRRLPGIVPWLIGEPATLWLIGRFTKTREGENHGR